MHEVVHIVPLGFEIDRAAAPFEKGVVATRVRILTILEATRDATWNSQQAHYVTLVKRRLEACRVRVYVEDVDTFDLSALTARVSQIILEEQAQGNEVFVNVSAAGKLQALGAGLAAMAHGAKLYYVEAEHYGLPPREWEKHGLSKSVGHIRYVPNVPIELPNARGIRVLVELAARPDGLFTADLIQALQTSGFDGFGAWSDASRLERTNYLMKLNKGILEPLARRGYIEETDRVGRRKRVRITNDGRMIASLSGLKPVLPPKNNAAGDIRAAANAGGTRMARRHRARRESAHSR